MNNQELSKWRGEVIEAMYRSLADQSSESIIVTDKDAEIAYVNGRFTEISGYEPEEVLGKNPPMFSAGQTPPGVYEKLWATLARGERWVGELLNHRKNGGLEIVRGLVAQLRGTMSWRSEGGLRYDIEFPLWGSDPQADQTRISQRALLGFPEA